MLFFFRLRTKRQREGVVYFWFFFLFFGGGGGGRGEHKDNEVSMRGIFGEIFLLFVGFFFAFCFVLCFCCLFAGGWGGVKGEGGGVVAVLFSCEPTFVLTFVIVRIALSFELATVRQNSISEVFFFFFPLLFFKSRKFRLVSERRRCFCFFFCVSVSCDIRLHGLVARRPSREREIPGSIQRLPGSLQCVVAQSASLA